MVRISVDQPWLIISAITWNHAIVKKNVRKCDVNHPHCVIIRNTFCAYYIIKNVWSFSFSRKISCFMKQFHKIQSYLKWYAIYIKHLVCSCEVTKYIFKVQIFCSAWWNFYPLKPVFREKQFEFVCTCCSFTMIIFHVKNRYYMELLEIFIYKSLFLILKSLTEFYNWLNVLKVNTKLNLK